MTPDLERVVREVRSRSDDLVEQMVQGNLDSVPELIDRAGDAELARAIRSSARSNLQAALEALESSLDPPASLSPGAREEAEQAAQSGLPLEALLRTYRIGHEIVLQALLDAIDSQRLGGPQRRALIRTVNRFGFDYIDGLIPMVRLAYEREREAMLGDRDFRRRDAIARILSGESATLATDEYPLRATHVAVVVAEGGCRLDWRGPVRELGCERLLVPAAGTGPLSVWLGRRRGWREGQLRELESWLKAEESRAGIGEPGRGLDGFRRSHREATLALRITTAEGEGPARYSRVAVEALALQDEAEAREFVARQLAPLSHAKDARKLQQTLRTYFDMGMNAAATAAALGVHPRTVGYRIAVAEQLLEVPLPEVRFQLEAALRLSTILG